MRKLIILFIPIIFLTACTSNEEDKIAYLEYKDELVKHDSFSEEKLDFNVYFNVNKDGEEVTNYSVIINKPLVNMYNVKALLIHDYLMDEAFPSVGILDDTITLLKDSDDKIELSGKIQTTDDVRGVKYKLYVEYIDDDGMENKVYYDVKRG